jgi:mRNA interferase RelE/StbE
MYKVVIERDAEKYIARLDRPTAKRIMNAIAVIAENPGAGERLTNHETAYKYRVGGFRILYDVYESEITVVVVKVASRGQVYRK